jgi:hypothetical protein
MSGSSQFRHKYPSSTDQTGGSSDQSGGVGTALLLVLVLGVPVLGPVLVLVLGVPVLIPGVPVPGAAGSMRRCRSMTGHGSCRRY